MITAVIHKLSTGLCTWYNTWTNARKSLIILDILELGYAGKVWAVGLSRPPAKLRINIRMSCAIYFIGYFLDIYPEQLFRYFKQTLKQGRYYLHYMNNINEFLHVVRYNRNMQDNAYFVRYNHNMQYNARSIMQYTAHDTVITILE